MVKEPDEGKGWPLYTCVGHLSIACARVEDQMERLVNLIWLPFLRMEVERKPLVIISYFHFEDKSYFPR